MSTVLSVRDLHVRFPTRRGDAHVVHGLSYDLAAGETIGIVGESGSGKSVSSLVLLGLLPDHAKVEGAVHFADRDLLGLDDEEWRRLRGNRIAMIFQDPMTSLNPVLTIGRQVTEGLQLHLGLDDRQARERAVELLAEVGISAPDRRLEEYPHQLSGGMRQRVMIAIALACEPEILIADEATTALDVTTQAQILDLIGRLQREHGTAVIWISHDLGVVAGLADRVLVMYAGRLVEAAAVDELYRAPSHPYTVGLLASMPTLHDRRDELDTIGGLPPDPTALPPGCPFHPRCAYRLDARCETEEPPLRDLGDGHLVASFYTVPDEDRDRVGTG